MASDLEALQAKAEELARLADGRPEAPTARRLAERLQAGRFLIAVVGEFKRGKSTLVNALVGKPVLPTGVLPLTAVAVELGFGEPAATVVHLDGRREAISRDRVAAYVTESGKPGERLGGGARGAARVLASAQTWGGAGGHAGTGLGPRPQHRGCQGRAARRRRRRHRAVGRRAALRARAGAAAGPAGSSFSHLLRPQQVGSPARRRARRGPAVRGREDRSDAANAGHGVRCRRPVGALL